MYPNDRANHSAAGGRKGHAHAHAWRASMLTAHLESQRKAKLSLDLLLCLPPAAGERAAAGRPGLQQRAAEAVRLWLLQGRAGAPLLLLVTLPTQKLPTHGLPTQTCQKPCRDNTIISTQIKLWQRLSFCEHGRRATVPKGVEDGTKLRSFEAAVLTLGCHACRARACARRCAARPSTSPPRCC